MEHDGRDGGRSYYESEESDGQYQQHRQHRQQRRQRRGSEGMTVPFPALVDSSLSTPSPGLRDNNGHGEDGTGSLPPELRSATELGVLTPADTTRSNSPLSVASGELGIVASRRLTTESVRTTASMQPTGPFRGLKRFWWHHVSVRVPRKQNRDHFALERTYLAYMRTSLTFAILGVLIAQLFSLNHAVVHNPQFGFHRVGKPLACVCHALAILVALAGAYRFWRQQDALARGKVYAGGRELNFIALISAGIIMVIFILVIMISAKRDSETIGVVVS
ncbi:conserved hypothetical protein [Microsporum canis CBS 113480]|uniref:DUF202 domain-containing protein n=1 Tax=Arthroderma otae (strain ATCC MYA-4605 / CBS 113480) TaxID=554155 RepID=C5FWT2_ARTOC|nr:conserved hypothetical protein [Microsporum canis CBS 113480]EEQ33339.1 conserved hypothetical protein [Microsporum canis CBS 113480]